MPRPDQPGCYRKVPYLGAVRRLRFPRLAFHTMRQPGGDFRRNADPCAWERAARVPGAIARDHPPVPVARRSRHRNPPSSEMLSWQAATWFRAITKWRLAKKALQMTAE